MAAAALEPRQQVGSIPEIVLNILDYLTPKERAKACLVSKEWRDIAQICLKRQVKVELSNPNPQHTKVSISHTDQHQPRNLLNNGGYNIPGNLPVHLVFEHETAPRGTFKCSTAAIAITLDLPWTPRVTHLTLDSCITIQDWSIIRNGIIKKLPNLLSIKILVLAKPNTIAPLPLCFAELLNECKPVDGTATYAVISDTLRSVYLVFRPFRGSTSYPVPFLYANICRDILSSCPKLTVLEQQGIYGLGNKIFVSRSTDRDNVKAEPSPTWTVGIGEMNRFDLTPEYAQFIRLILTLVPINKVCLPYHVNLIATLQRDPEIQQITSNLEKLCLYSWISEHSSTLSTLISNQMFANVTNFFWSYDPYKSMDLWRNAPVGEVTFPKLEVLHLHRKTSASYQIGNAQVPINLYSIDDWICINSNRIAPRVQQLTVNAYNESREPRSPITEWRDVHKVLQIAASFRTLKHLLLINNQSPIMDLVWSELENVAGVATSLQGLITVKLAVKDPQLVPKYSRAFVQAAATPEATIESLEILFQKNQEAQEVQQEPPLVSLNLNQYIETNDQYCLRHLERVQFFVRGGL